MAANRTMEESLTELLQSIESISEQDLQSIRESTIENLDWLNVGNEGAANVLPALYLPAKVR